jgi:hypothetical protein
MALTPEQEALERQKKAEMLKASLAQASTAGDQPAKDPRARDTGGDIQAKQSTGSATDAGRANRKAEMVAGGMTPDQAERALGNQPTVTTSGPGPAKTEEQVGAEAFAIKPKPAAMPGTGTTQPSPTGGRLAVQGGAVPQSQPATSPSMALTQSASQNTQQQNNNRQAELGPGVNTGHKGSVSALVDKANNSTTPEPIQGTAGTARDFIKVNESLIQGDAREVFTGTPTKTGAITETGFNILTGGMAPKAGEKVGGFARDVDQTTRDFFARLDPTNTKIPKASTEGIDTAQKGVSDVGVAANELGDRGRTLADNPSQFNFDAPVVGPASQASVGPDLTTGTIRGITQQVTANTISPAQIAELQKMEAAGISREDIAFREKQMALANSLEQAAAGNGPSVANIQLQKANEDAIKAQAAIAASARGGNPILAQRQAAQNVASLQQENAAKSAELKIQEQQQARAQLGDVLSQARGQDIGVNTSQAGFQQEASKVDKLAEDERAFKQTELDQDAAKTTADLKLKADTFNSDQDFKAAMSDEERKLDAAKTSYLANIDVSKFNATAKNEMEKLRVDSLLRTKLASQASELALTQMGIDAIAKKLGIQVDTAKAILASETQKYTSEQDRLTAQKGAEGKMAGNIIGSAATAIASMSDETMKANVKPLDIVAPAKVELSKDPVVEKDKKSFADVLKESTAPANSKIEDSSDGILAGVRAFAAKGSESEGAKGAKEALSDETSKKKVKSDNPKIDALLASLDGYEYEYKDTSMPGTAKGKRFGVMAQDLERTPAGASIVKTDPNTGKKMIDVEQATGVLFASLGRLNDKIDQLSKKRK